MDLVEYFATETDTGGYGLTGSSTTSVLSCRCQSWVCRRWLRPGRPLWTIAVSVRAGIDATDGALVPGGAAGGRRRGLGARARLELVRSWIDGAGRLPTTFDDALATLG